MNETYSINLNGRRFFIDTDAYQHLTIYLDKIKSLFRSQEGGEEIISDIESRFSEIFSQKIDPETGVISLQMVEEVIKIMGQPEDFESNESSTKREKGRPDRDSEQLEQHSYSKKLYRNIDDRVLAGVCSGIASYFNLDPTLVRVLYAIISLASVGTGLIVYLILWVVIQPALTTAQKLEMQGESINISNIERKVKEEYEEVKANFKKMKDSDAFQRSSEYFKRKDRNLLIGIAIVLAFFIIAPLFVFIGLPLIGAMTFPFFSIPMIFPFKVIGLLIIILLVLGLVNKKLTKPLIYTIVILIVVFIVIRIIFALIHHTWFFTHFNI